MKHANSDDAIPSVDTSEMIEVDRAMIEDYQIELIQMMENAGRNLAHLARSRFLGGDPREKRVLVLEQIRFNHDHNRQRRNNFGIPAR